MNDTVIVPRFHIIHHWTNWVDVSRVTIFQHQGDKVPSGYALRQEARCTICNAVKFREALDR